LTILDMGAFSAGEEVEQFERSVPRYLCSTQAIACANGTDALELLLRAIGIREGGKVIIPALTGLSTAEMVVLVGDKPIF